MDIDMMKEIYESIRKEIYVQNRINDWLYFSDVCSPICVITLNPRSFDEDWDVHTKGKLFLNNHEERFNIFMDTIFSFNKNECDEIIRAKRMIGTMLGFPEIRDMIILPSLCKKGMFSYSRKPEEDDDVRTMLSFGRLIRRKLSIPREIIRDDVLAKLSEIIVTSIWKEVEGVERLYGAEIVEAYRLYKGSSCMNGDRCKYVEIYAHNNNASLLVSREPRANRPVAKALLWTSDSGELLLDRLYANDDYYEKGMDIVRFARNLGACIGEKLFSRQYFNGHQVTLDYSKCEHLPYIDSFCTISKHNAENSTIVLSCTNETNLHDPHGRGIVVCTECSTKYVCVLSNICPSCSTVNIEKSLFVCTDCDSNFYCEDNVYRIQSDGNRIVCDECIRNYRRCSNCNDWFRPGRSDSDYCDDCEC